VLEVRADVSVGDASANGGQRSRGLADAERVHEVVVAVNTI
jgi:hypothetical protein